MNKQLPKSKFVPIMILIYSALSIAIMITLRVLVYVAIRPQT